MTLVQGSRRIAAAMAAIPLSTMTGAALAGQFALAPHMASGPTINCSVPNNVVCTITSAKGLKLVRITSNTPQGTVNVVDEAYRGCPREVKVAWDSAYQMSGKQIVECGGFKLKAR